MGDSSQQSEYHPTVNMENQNGCFVTRNLTAETIAYEVTRTNGIITLLSDDEIRLRRTTLMITHRNSQKKNINLKRQIAVKQKRD